MYLGNMRLNQVNEVHLAEGYGAVKESLSRPTVRGISPDTKGWHWGLLLYLHVVLGYRGYHYDLFESR